MPYLLRRLAGLGDVMRIAEEFEWLPGARTLVVRVENASERHIAAFLEVAVFEPCPAAPHSACRYTSWVECAADSAAGRSMLRLLPASPAALLAKHVETLTARARDFCAEVQQGPAPGASPSSPQLAAAAAY